MPADQHNTCPIMEIDDQPADLDLGGGYLLRFTCWKPDRDLNPQYADLPDVDRLGAIVEHPKVDGKCGRHSVLFDSEVARRVFPGRPLWAVVSWEPLTCTPSLLCQACGDHGFVREGMWVPA